MLNFRCNKLLLQHLSGNKTYECISKQAYYEVEINSISIVSLRKDCDKILTKAFQSATFAPENLKIKIIKSPEEFDYILRVVCYVACKWYFYINYLKN